MLWNGLELPESYFHDDDVYIINGDCREQSLSSISAIVTDPPYELGFMGKSWDSKGVSFQKETWEKIKSYCLSGSPLLSFGGSRTQHRIACAIEDAGWEIRDTLMWVYGSGFPKSLDIGKAIDKMKGIERKVVGVKAGHEGFANRGNMSSVQSLKGTLGGEGGFARPWMDDPEAVERYHQATAPATPEAQLWDGYGTALKPAYEPIILGMNPLDRTFANNALKYGVAGLNIDECRVGTDKPPAKNTPFESWRNLEGRGDRQSPEQTYNPNEGRFPANFLHDGSDEVLELFPKTGKSSGGKSGHTGAYGGGYKEEYYKGEKPGFGDNGSASRFFYCAKASKSERSATNNHPTVKPLALMEYLCKLVKMPEYNIILDPFCGSGTTLLACMKLGIKAIGIDSDEQSCEIAAIRYLRSLND